VKGEFRTRDLEHLAGERRTITVQKEYGLRYELDLSTVYFSPRLATERKRISDMAQPGERVIDMFCGVGPFSIMLAKTGKPSMVYAVDKNPEAIKYLIKNIEINKIKGISHVEGDAREMVPRLPRPDRFVMNLPHTAIDFLDVALAHVARKGMIHLYLIMEAESEALIRKSIARLAVSMGRGIAFKGVREVHTYSPTQALFCLDILVG
jgi:tRNA (guanine37-N1)-methyltransferase